MHLNFIQMSFSLSRKFHAYFPREIIAWTNLNECSLIAGSSVCALATISRTNPLAASVLAFLVFKALTKPPASKLERKRFTFVLRSYALNGFLQFLY